ncbi:MAG: hypothetical protein BWK76_28040 [Desulfobulbaceae bacterium A2]|nr:MAG: hypothetical protein BWK76_28040 [Desulfobulbaceae bacterium A2]
MNKIRLVGRFLAFLFLLVLSACNTTDHQDFLDDRPGLLDHQARQHIIEYHGALLKDFNIHCKVVILAQPSNDINSDAAVLFANLGEKTGKARGLLFMIDPVGKQVRIEVGYDLEGIFPDIFVSYIEQEQMVPFFQQAKVGAGIEATEELFVARAQRSVAGESFEPAVELGGLAHYSGGGGARTTLAIGEGPVNKAAVADLTAYLPQQSPEQSLTVYMRLLRHKIKDPDLALYTAGTRKFLARWVVTDAQQDNELSRLEGAVIDKVAIAGNRAVIRFPAEQRTLPPYFLENNGNGWELDFAAMSDLIQMNHTNMWHFVFRDHPYMFAFADWRFDSNGYPVLTR